MESLPQDELSNSKKGKIISEISFGLGGILFGLVFIAIVMAVLNYFNIISLFPFIKQPAQTTQPAKIMPKPSDQKLLQSRKQIEPLAKKAGYSIYFILASNGNYNDLSGRYMLASKERIVDGWTDQFGWQTLNSKNVSRISGIFSEWENISGSKDRYVVFFTDKIFSKKNKVRVVFEGGSVNASNSGTILKVDNLDYGPLNNKIKPIGTINYFAEIPESNLNKIIKHSDIITIDVSIKLSTVKDNKSTEMLKDENGIPIAQNIQIRRFGGINTVNKELGK